MRGAYLIERILVKHPPPQAALCAGGAKPKFTEGDQLRWDLLSQGLGLFLK